MKSGIGFGGGGCGLYEVVCVWIVWLGGVLGLWGGEFLFEFCDVFFEFFEVYVGVGEYLCLGVEFFVCDEIEF